MNPNPNDVITTKQYYVYVIIGKDRKYARRFPVIAIGHTDDIDKTTKMFEYRTAYEYFHPELMCYTFLPSLLSEHDIQQYETGLTSICMKYELKRHNIDHIAPCVPDENFFSLIVDQKVKHDNYIMAIRELLERINSDPKTIEHATKEYKRLFVNGSEHEQYYPTLTTELYGTPELD